MADGLNQVMLLGNLGADPEFRVTPNGNSVLKLRLATTQSYLDRNRVRQERTEWHSVAIWGKRAEALAKILGKGSRIFVSGELRTNSWEDEHGAKRYRTEVSATNIILAGGARRGGSSRNTNEQGDAYEGGEQFAGDYPPADDDIPF